jgi:hypothetical protein
MASTTHPCLILAQVSSAAQQRAHCFEWKPDVSRNGPLCLEMEKDPSTYSPTKLWAHVGHVVQYALSKLASPSSLSGN